MHLRSIIGTVFIGWFALAVSAPADIIWSGDRYLPVYQDPPAIDFNLDGTDDFVFEWSFTDSPYGRFYRTYIEPTNGQILVDAVTGSGVSLRSGIPIGSSPQDAAHEWTGAKSSLFAVAFTGAQSPDFGGFFGAGYLGVSFDLEGSTHYGWIELSHDENRPDYENLLLMVHGWAWETEADTAILAGAIPEPSTGILTMVGSLALLHLARSRRRRRKQTHKPTCGYRIPQEPKEPEKW